jgi:hypothetical protein
MCGHGEKYAGAFYVMQTRRQRDWETDSVLFCHGARIVLNPQRPGWLEMLRVETTRAPALTSEFKLRRHRESAAGNRKMDFPSTGMLTLDLAPLFAKLLPWMETSVTFFNFSKPGEPTLSAQWRFAGAPATNKDFSKTPTGPKWS